jgi:signal transduction histidine kinase/DNA-binding response OmpR family regulator
MKNLVFLIAIFFQAQTLLSQQSIVDSLEAELQTATVDTNRILILGDLAYFTYDTDPEKSMEYARQTLVLSEAIGYIGGQINGWFKMALANLSMSNLDSAAFQLEQSLRLALEEGNQNKILVAYNLGGVIYDRKGDTEKAIDYIFESAKISEKLGDSIGAGSAYNNLGEIYDKKGDKDLAYQFFYKSYEIGKAAKNTLNWVASAINLSNVENDHQKRFFYLNEALNLSEKANFESGKAYAYSGLAHYYWQLKSEKQQAVNYFREAINYAQKTGDQFKVMSLYISIGDLFSQMSQSDSAVYYLKKGRELADSYGADEQQIQARINLAHHFQRNKQFQEAFDNLNESAILKDSLFSQNLAEQLAVANTKYETEKKEAQIAEQQLKLAQEKNTRNRIIFGSILLLLLASGIFQWYFNRQKIKKKEAELALEKELEEAKRLRELDNLKTSFFTNISHELRTPLTLITGPLEDALQKDATENQREDLELAHSNSKKLLGLVNEILDLSKLEAGKLKLNQHKLHFLPFLKRVFFAFDSLASLKKVKLEIEGEVPENLWITTDADKLEKILNNLISNAIKHSPADNYVFLNHQINKGRIEISVMDNGEGIPESEREKVFDRFYQVEHPNAMQQGGTGIGLALSKELSHLLGGSLVIESLEGTGSTFTLSIPLVETEPPAVGDRIPEVEIENETETETYKPILIEGQKPKILVVEDNLEMARYLDKILKKEYRISIAPNGVDAIKLLQTEHFDLVTSDVMMPLMDGFELREKVNRMGKHKDTPYIFLTARALEEDRLKGLQMGVDDYITKPFSANELKVRIQNLLQNKINRSQENQDENGDLNADQRQLKQAEIIVFENLSNPQFKVSELATRLGLGERQLRRVMQSLTGLSPVNFILEIRLQKARQLLEEKKHFTVAEVMYEIGIESPSYFSKKFKERFGRSPSGYLS